MPDYPPGVLDHVAQALLAAGVPGGLRAAEVAIAALEEVWPHDPPKRDLTGTTAGEFGRGPQQRIYRRQAPPDRQPFGFGPT